MLISHWYILILFDFLFAPLRSNHTVFGGASCIGVLLAGNSGVSTNTPHMSMLGLPTSQLPHSSQKTLKLNVHCACS